MPGILCEHFTAVCSGYIALPLDTVMTPEVFAASVPVQVYVTGGTGEA